MAGIPDVQFNGHETGDGSHPQARLRNSGFRGRGIEDDRCALRGGKPGLMAREMPNRQKFVVVGWTNPEGSRPHLGALLLGYYADDGKLIYAGHVGTGMPGKVLVDFATAFDPLARSKSPLSAPPPRTT